MNGNLIHIAVLILICCISAFSQVLLKKASTKKYTTFLQQYLNPYVITGYGMFFAVLAVNIWLLRFLPVTVCSAFSESLPLVLSLVTGRIIFNEQLTKTGLAGAALVIAGILFIVL